MPETPGTAELDQTEVGSISSRITRRFRSGRRRPSPPTRLARAATRPAGTCRSGCTSTSPSAASAAISATSASTPTRTRARSSSTSTWWRGSGSSTRGRRRLPGRPLELRLLRRRHAVVPVDHAAAGARLAADRRPSSWNGAEEITFECEPGTLTEPKLEAIRKLGVTRLSLGVENFDDHILEVNGRAHRSPEIDRTYGSRARSASRRSTST